MCVIAIVRNKRPSEEMVEQMFAKNAWGGGVAWPDSDEHGTPLVKWQKGLDLEAMQKVNRDLKTPYILHFRVPSGGTATDDGVCHPFPLEDDVSIALEGSTYNAVLFHNGHWGSWKFDIKEAAIKGGWKLPMGAWSDTRALALMAHKVGLGILEFIDEKVVIMRADGEIILFKEDQWKKVNDIWVSNDLWTIKVDNKLPTHYQQQGQNGRSGGNGTFAPFRSSDERGARDFFGIGRHQNTNRLREEDQTDRAATSGRTNSEAVQQAASRSGKGNENSTLTDSTREGREQTARELARWIREDIMPREHGSVSNATKVSDLKCEKCLIRNSFIFKDGIRRCYECWEKEFNLADDLCDICFQKPGKMSDKGMQLCADCYLGNVPVTH